MKTTVQVLGLKQTAEAMKELKRSTARTQTRKALMAGGEVLAQAARSMAPVSSGDLQEHISVSSKLSAQGKKDYTKTADQEVFVGPDDRPQGIQQEFGNVTHPPQPFLRPAWDSTKHQVLKTISDNMMVNVQQAVARARAKAAK